MAKRAVWWIAGLLAIILLLLIIAATAFYISYSNGSLIRYVKQNYAHNVEFTLVHHGWYRWSPDITVKHVKIAIPGTKQSALTLKEADIRVDLLASIWHWTLVTGRLHLTGMNLQLQQDHMGEISLKGQAISKTTHRTFKEYWHWIRLQQTVLVDHVDFDLHRFMKPMVSGRAVTLQWKGDNDSSHNFYMSTQFPQAGLGHLQIHAVVSGNIHSKHEFKAQFTGQLSGSDFGQVLKRDSYNGYHLLHGGGQVSLSGNYSHGLFTALKMRAELKNINTVSDRYQPAIEGDMSLKFDGSELGGSVQLTSSNLIVSHSSLFPHDWPAMSVDMTALWQHKNNGWQIQFTPLSAKTKQATLDMKGTVTIPAQFKNTKLDLQASVHGNRLGPVVSKYIPKQGVSADLYEWLNHNILKVGQAYATMNIKGLASKIPYPNGHGTFNVTVHVKNGDIIPYKAWPKVTAINGNLQFINARFIASADSGLIYSDPVNQVRVEVPNLMPGVPSKITVDGSMLARGAHTERFVKNSPLKNVIHLFDVASLSGPYRLNIHLAFPLANPKANDTIQGNILFKDNVLALKNTNIAIDKLTGQIHFVKMTLSSKDGLTGQFLSHPMSISMTSKKGKKGIETSSIHFAGILDMDAMRATSKAPIFQHFKGSAPISATLIKNDKQSHVSVFSDLQGVESTLPVPFEKSATDKEPLSISVDATSGQSTVLHASIGKRLGAELNFETHKNRTVLTQGEINIGVKAPVQLNKNQLIIRGHLPVLSAEAWVKQLQPFYQHSGTAVGSFDMSAPIIADFSVGKLDLYGQQFNNLEINAKRLNGLNVISLKAKQIDGLVSIPLGHSDKPIVVRFKQIHLKKSAAKKSTEKSKLVTKHAMKLSPSEFSTWPAIDFQATHLFLNDRDLGLVRIQTIPKPYGVEFKKLAWVDENINLGMQGLWWQAQKSQPGSNVIITGSAKGNNWGNALKQIGFGGFLTLSTGPVNFNLAWKGGLFDPETKTLNGDVSFDLKAGLLTNVNPGISRLLGLFSLEALSRRLTLNFSDLTKKGLAFNSLTGSYRLKGGIATTDKVAMTGPAIDLNLKGTIDLNNKTMDQTVVVMPHTDSGLAIAATIIGGPIAGIATWIADSIFSNTVLKNKGLTYSLTGPWEKPIFKSIDGKTIKRKSK